MNGISTHILDTTKGHPASGIKVQLFNRGVLVGTGTTGRDGRIEALLPESVNLELGEYRLQFLVGSYFPNCFYSEVSITFLVSETDAHHHIPLLISPFGYTTYRGS